MIRADLHIHTLATAWDEPFEFDLDQLRQHVVDNRLDVIAVTNHNTFDKEQYDWIAGQLANLCTVLPGVEVSALRCHILVIVKPEEAASLETSCKDVSRVLAGDAKGSLSFDDFVNSFPYLDEAIVIPHYTKHPSISEENLKKIAPYVSAVEVSSLAKAIRFNKVRQGPYPAVAFTDYRFGCESVDGKRDRYNPSSVYLRTSGRDFASVKASINYDDLSLNSTGIEDDFEFAPGITVSKGVNLILGKRSTGKTFTLDRIASLCDEGDAYYIEQGELVDASREKSFYDGLDIRFASLAQRYREPWNSIMSEAAQRGTKADRRSALRAYLEALKKHAETSTLSDVYAKCRLFNAGKLDEPDVGDAKALVDAVITLLSSEQHANLIDEVVGRARLLELLRRLVEEARAIEKSSLAVKEANAIARAVKRKLNVSTVEQMPDPILEKVFDDEAFFKKAADLLGVCWQEKRICDDGGETFSRYSVIATRRRYTRAQDVKDALRLDRNVSLQGITNLEPNEFIDKLLSLSTPEPLAPALFDVQIGVRDDKDAEPSGGQRTECVFLGRLAEAAGAKFVLIDEPESSFDNPFLNEFISKRIRGLGSTSTVVVATHNQVLGLALQPNKILLTTYDSDAKQYGLAVGGPHESTLTLGTGEEGPDAHTTVLDILEAGEESYNQRRAYYKEVGTR